MRWPLVVRGAFQSRFFSDPLGLGLGGVWAALAPGVFVHEQVGHDRTGRGRGGLCKGVAARSSGFPNKLLHAQISLQLPPRVDAQLRGPVGKAEIADTVVKGRMRHGGL